jgi:endogenous inhibitor of DNA gyrase (YacG/DUF329 family)
VSAARVTCPTCKRDIVWEESAYRPFCSERCRLIDLGAWLSEQHAIPGETAQPEDGAAPGTDGGKSTSIG